MSVENLFFKEEKIYTNGNEILSKILLQRNLKTEEERYNFLNPQLKNLYNPLEIDNIDAAVNIILNSLNANEKILIFGDYDVDGTTSIALLFRFFKDHFTYSTNVSYDLADRFEEGYGFSKSAAERAIQAKINLIITVDCGIKDFEAIEIAKKAGIKVLVVDHHEIDETREHPADVVLDLKKKSCKYPFHEFSACGLAFKLICAILIKTNKDFKKAYEYLDLVGLSTACDLVPLINENRILMYHGLKKINKNPILGLQKMIDAYNLTSIEMHDSLFKLGPTINAAGRLDTAKIAVELLLTEDEFEAEQLVKQLIKLNCERKKLCSKIIEDIKPLCENNKKSTVLFNENWHQGVLGISAAKCINIKYSPTIIMTKAKDHIVGSARSIDNFDIYSIIERCSDLLLGFGGHKMAAGITLKQENLDLFKKRFEEEVEKETKGIDLSPKINIDFKIDLKDITKDFFYFLEQLNPFGIGNEAPTFASVVTCEEYSIDYNTLLIKIDINNVHYLGIGYDLTEKEYLIADKKPFLLIFEFKNIINENIVLNIKEIDDIKNFEF